MVDLAMIFCGEASFLLLLREAPGWPFRDHLTIVCGETMAKQDGK